MGCATYAAVRRHVAGMNAGLLIARTLLRAASLARNSQRHVALCYSTSAGQKGPETGRLCSLQCTDVGLEKNGSTKRDQDAQHLQVPQPAPGPGDAPKLKRLVPDSHSHEPDPLRRVGICVESRCPSNTPTYEPMERIQEIS
jgi:hypothetical protein